MTETAELRGQVYRAAHEYHAALAAYCHAARRGEDIESPTQVLLGKGLFYYLALSRLLARESTGRIVERMSYLRESQQVLARRYALLKQARPSPVLPAP